MFPRPVLPGIWVMVMSSPTRKGAVERTTDLLSGVEITGIEYLNNIRMLEAKE